MNTIQAIILAIIEGLTEFLPVSSTAHMRIANDLIGITHHGSAPSPFVDFFEIVIQLPAILAIVVLFWRKFFDFRHYSFYIKLIIALIPAVIFGILLKKHIDAALDNLVFIACVMAGGGILLLFVDNLFKRPRIDQEQKITYSNAFVIGCFQVLSILLPGFSRSAATIIGGMAQKLTRRLAAEFSFFVAVPTMFAATVKSFWDVYKEHHEVLAKENMSLLGIGSVVSFFVALITVKLFIGYVQKHNFKPFGVYRILLGAAILILLYTGRI
jgi:undecaprenyl-diphosphatase